MNHTKKFLMGFSALLSLLSIALFSPTTYADKENVLYFYNWSEYIPTEILTDFTKETGIKVIYSTYESNESLYAKLKTHGSGYDLIVPSTYFVSKMRNEQMIQPIDKRKLEHFKELDSNFLNKPFDPNNEYSIPYIWGATGIGINADILNQAEITSWADLWDPKWKNSLIMMDDAREFFQIALAKLNLSANTTNPDEIKQAYEELKKLMPNVLLFNSDNPATPFIAGSVNLGMMWNGSAYMARQEGIPVNNIWPKEGAIFWMDSLAIPSQAKNVDAAYQMIDFLLRPENATRIAEEIGYPTPVKGAYPLLESSFKNDLNIYPPQEVLTKGQWQTCVGDATVLYEEYFQKLKAGQ